MASYATVAELREYLTQVPDGAAVDAVLQKVLDRATDTIDGRLGFSITAYGNAAEKDVRCPGYSQYLELPPHQANSVSAVAWVSDKATDAEATTAITDYAELDDGRLYRGFGWIQGVWYRVTASWGYGDPSNALKEVCLEIAINLYGARDSRQISDVVGVEGGGAVGYQRALTNRQQMIIDDVRARYGHWGFA